MTVQEKIISWLFSTKAFQVCQPDQPFWYTSGTLGPFYINTHYLYGSEAEANRLLELIDQNLSNPSALIPAVRQDVELQYRKNRLYREVCDLIAESLCQTNFDLISGGERRDWFFSYQAALLLGKPHLTLFKNGDACLNPAGSVSGAASGSAGNLAASGSLAGSGGLVGAGGLQGQKVVHVADLVTEASSYQRAWLPAISRCGATVPVSVAIIDRNQGGREYLASAGTQLRSLTQIDRAFFQSALAEGQIDTDQFNMIEKYLANPESFMESFVKDHPCFLDQQISMGGKNKERALRYLEKIRKDPAGGQIAAGKV